MIKNVGKTDKTIRIVLGLLIMILGVYLNNWWGILGLVLLATGLINFCGLYKLFGFSTYKEEKPPVPPASQTPPTSPSAN